MARGRSSVAIVGAGIAGIAACYYLTRRGLEPVTLIDQGQPMAFTSAKSGENYRNWWPHPVMTAFTDLSIDLMEELARNSGDAFRMTRRGYALATRETDLSGHMAMLERGYAAERDAIRVHEGDSPAYRFPSGEGWEGAPTGVDVLLDPSMIRRIFPSFAPEIRAVIHIRRAGDLDSHALGQVMLARAREAGLQRWTGLVTGIDRRPGGGFALTIAGEATKRLEADIVVNAAGPFLGEVAAMLGADPNIRCVRQQKLAFEDTAGAIPRDMPFAIDLDCQTFDWSAEERALLLEDETTAWLARPMPGAVHCKADGGRHGTWIKLGWAYTTETSTPSWEPPLDEGFPEIVLRGAARLNPALRSYLSRLPRRTSHYGGYYTMTPENWPLIGRLGPEGAYAIGALSGFGTMAACAAGALLAAEVAGTECPAWAPLLGPARRDDRSLMAELTAIARESLL